MHQRFDACPLGSSSLQFRNLLGGQFFLRPKCKSCTSPLRIIPLTYASGKMAPVQTFQVAL
jgi:hypothetical protein